MDTQTLYVRDASGEFVPADGNAVVTAAKTHLRRRIRRGASLTSPKLVRDFLIVTLGDRDCEYFCLVCLDARYRFLRFVELFRGTIDGASVHPREVVKCVIESESCAVLLVHNHPSHAATLSQADELITKKLRDCLATIDVKVIDHLVVAGDSIVSAAELGLL